jgi:phosphate transport system substrate-binding protein
MVAPVWKEIGRVAPNALRHSDSVAPVATRARPSWQIATANDSGSPLTASGRKQNATSRVAEEYDKIGTLIFATQVAYGRVAMSQQRRFDGNTCIVTGGGSGTGIAAMIDGRTDIAQASRAMKPEEIKLAEDRGIDPKEHVVATDALSVIVNPGNPVSKLTVDQLSDIYTGKITNWKQVGGSDQKIILLSRDKNSGSHVFFLEHVVRRGNEKGPEEYAKSALMFPSTEQIATQVTRDKGSIGYVGLGYVDPKKHKAIAVAKTAAGPYVKPTEETAINGTYPIARPLYWYTNGEAKGNIKSFLDFALSSDGQKIVTETGFAPVKKS